MGLADVALWFNIIITCSLLIVVFYGVRNTLRSSKNNESIMNSGQEVEAIVIDAKPHDNQTANGRLFISLLIEFIIGDEKISTNKDTNISSFYAEEYKPGKLITVKYQRSNLQNIIVVGNVNN
ncbi:hypothetical protein FS595_23120 [Serratia rubidaea]|uniref:hypothetical protein n=1 Tax=Serratia rubidaea TaxID=61652 RepID=UPI001F38EDB6|nr:hypothetical protein [Serratia rubidaea]UJD82447.1 hypothetical protein FS596_23125 [Serratia rubidaea]UJD87012.1 hypothetical protein FS595_23120 [Serratia rubidaea]